MKLSMEEREDLTEVSDHPGYKVILKCLDAIKADQANRVLEYSLEAGSDRELAFAKARHEGAWNLVNNFKNHIKTIKRSRRS